jgi:hypothetical protein
MTVDAFDWRGVRRSYPSVEQALAAAFATADIGDEVVQHAPSCDLTDACGCAVIVYRLAVDGWVVEARR